MVPDEASASAYRKTIVWGDHESGHGVTTDLDWHFSQFGKLSDGALTLARVGSAIFLADRTVTRNDLRQQRQIHLIVPIPDVDLANAAREQFTGLANFVTGDDWRFKFEHDPTEPPDVDRRYEADEVALLSGGLDSFCGALIGGTTDRLFLAHNDASVIKYSQNNSFDWIPHLDEARHVSVRLTARRPFNREPSRRSRSILFMALGVALADAAGARTLEVPENGFTSLNPPLAANRGGVLTTRSTHPLSFHLATDLIRALQLSTVLSNPYEWLTKGELIRNAAAVVGPRVVEDGAAHTLSCAKSNLILRGKTYGRNCGLDYACVVRRAGMLASGLNDKTLYECHTPGLEQLVLDRRIHDVKAVRLALASTPSVARLATSCGPFPPEYDYESGLDLWKRGRDEIAALPLP